MAITSISVKITIMPAVTMDFFGTPPKAREIGISKLEEIRSL